MNLFSRSLAVSPENADGGYAVSVEIADYISKNHDVPVTPWTTVYGAPLGIVTFSCRIDSLAAMGALDAALLADKKYLDVVATAAGKLVGPVQDGISQFVAMSGEPNLAGKFAAIVSAQAAGGKIAESMGWGVDILNHVTSVTGVGGSFVRGLYGDWARVSWIALFDSLEEIDAYEAKQSSDEAYIKKVDKAGDLFVEASASQILLRRLS
jgi:hypothetical protein